MAQTRPTRIYVSAMETEVDRQAQLDPQAAELLAKLAVAGYNVRWVKESRDYPSIERDIAASDALIAIVDPTWASSTWMASEASWAAGLCGARETGNPKMKPIPILLYPVAERIGSFPVGERFPFNQVEAVVVGRDPSRAVGQIRDLLPPRRAVTYTLQPTLHGTTSQGQVLTDAGDTDP